MAKNRYIGEYPVIGIRPTIDGRRGPLKVRESLEDQTMAMAQAAKKLFEENICYTNGEPVKVVIADTSWTTDAGYLGGGAGRRPGKAGGSPPYKSVNYPGSI